MIRHLVPIPIRNYLKRQLGIQFLLEQNAQLQQRLTLLENKFYGSQDELERDAKRRWQHSHPDQALTWSQQLPGTAFIRLAARYDLFGPDRNILEIGPGYGRLLTAMQQDSLPLAYYLGVDISPNQVQHLCGQFGAPQIEFLCADVETFAVDRQFDSVLSSLTFKHLFPSFRKAMENVGRHLRPGGRGCIDFIEGDRRLFEEDGVTFIRQYRRDEIADLMDSAGFEVIAFEQVTHADSFTRLVAIVEKRPIPAKD